MITNRIPSSYWEEIIEITLLLFIFCTPLIFNPETDSTFLVPKDTFSQVVLLCLVLFSLLKILHKRRVEWVKTSFHLPLLLLIPVAAFSLFAAKNLYLAGHDLLKLISFILLLFVVENTIRKPEQVARVGTVILAVSTIISLYGILQYQGIDLFNFWVGNVGRKRMFSTFGNPNFLAGYLVAVAPLAFVICLYGKSLFKRVSAGLVFVLCLLPIFVSQTRGAWLAFAGSFIFLTITLMRYQKKEDGQRCYGRRRLRIIFILFLILAAIFLVGLSSRQELPALAKRVVTIFTFQEPFRRFVWHATLEMVHDYPFLGVGIGNFRLLYLDYQERLIAEVGEGGFFPDTNVFRAHNDYIQLWAEMGTMGLLLIIWLVITFYKEAFRAIRQIDSEHERRIISALLAGCTAVLIHAFFSFPFHLSSTASVFVTLAAIVIASRAIYQGDEWRRCITIPFRRMGLRVIMGLILTLVIAYLTVVPLRTFTSNLYLKLAAAYLEREEEEVGLSMVRKALKLDRHSGKGHFLHGCVYTTRKEYDKAIAAFEQALLTFSDVNIHHNLGVVYRHSGDYEQSVAHWQKVIAVRPDMLMARRALAKVYEEMGELDKSLAVYEKMLELSPENVEVTYIIGRLRAKKSDWEQAIKCWKRVIELAPEHFEVYRDLAKAYSLSGSTTEAEIWWKKYREREGKKLPEGE